MKSGTAKVKFATSYSAWIGQQDKVASVANPENFWDEAHKQSILTNVAQLTERFSEHLADQIGDPEIKAILTKTFILEAFSACAKHSDENLEFDCQVLMGDTTEQDYIHKNRFLSLSKVRKPYELDFLSPTGKKISNIVTPLSPLLRRDEYSGWKNWLQNQIAHVSGNNRFRIDAAVRKGRINKNNVREDSFEDDFRILCSLLITQYQAAKAACSAFLSQVPHKPVAARFNQVGSPTLAGYVSALNEHQIPTTMLSQGCMVAHGGGAREKIARILSCTIYNSFVGIQTTMPRSPLQMIEGSEKPQIKSRLSAPRTRKTAEPFTILYAPNFLSFGKNYHGMTPTCFETRKCAEGLVAAVKQMNIPVKLNIRLKTTNADIAKQRDNQKSASRGILPAHLEDLYDPKANIFDASLGSHSELIQSADLIVAEGCTAVLWEALEERKPLLLLNLSSKRIPALPALSYQESQRHTKRAAVYSSGIDEELPKLLSQIHDQHLDKPLTDDELRNYIWV